VRVLALVHLYPPTGNAGAEWALHTLLAELAGQLHDVDVVLTDPDAGGDPYVLDGVWVHPYRSKHDPVRAIVDNRPDVLITHLKGTPQATMLGDLYGLPVVHVLHNDHVNERTWLTRHPSLVVYNSAWVRDSCLSWWRQTQTGHPPAGIVVRPPVIAADYATTPGSRVTLVNVCANKGANVFWRLAERMPDVPFLAVEGAYGTQIVKDLPNVEVQEHIPGRHMRDAVYSRTRLLLAPSSYESWGRVTVEAMTSGIPVIAHPTPGLVESLGTAGTFVDRDDIDGWEQQIRRLLQEREWVAASERATQRAAELNPDDDLRRWVQSVEAVATPRVGAR
jgi:glycosyltransferase involved in cell wall biosynthesis